MVIRVTNHGVFAEEFQLDELNIEQGVAGYECILAVWIVADNGLMLVKSISDYENKEIYAIMKGENVWRKEKAYKN